MKAVVFDFDGVLFETPLVYYHIYHQIADTMGVPRFSSFQDWQRALHGSNGNWRYIFSVMGIHADNHSEAEKVFERHVQNIGLKAKPYVGIPEVFSVLRSKGVKIGIVSSNYVSYIEAMLKRYNLTVDHIVGYEFGILKPQPDPLLHCVRQLQCRREEVLYVGDMRIDIETGRNAGVRTVVVSYGLEPEELLCQAQPDTIISIPHDILSYV